MQGRKQNFFDKEGAGIAVKKHYMKRFAAKDKLAKPLVDKNKQKRTNESGCIVICCGVTLFSYSKNPVAVETSKPVKPLSPAKQTM